jgi:FkbM family methyltransferase
MYLKHAPFPRGKGVLRRFLVEPLLPPDPAEFEAAGPLGGRVRFRYREVLGLTQLLTGGFETAEICALCALAHTGSTAIDVGANIGVFTIPLAQSVGSTGLVIAFEPLAGNARRLHGNVTLNALGNVRIDCRAVGARSDVTSLRVAIDPAFGSTAGAPEGRDAGVAIEVPVVPLDDVWHALGNPSVSVMKIDVEGGEMDVLLGARTLVRSELPALLVEANEARQAQSHAAFLRPLGYEASQPRGFEPWNFLYQAGRDAPHGPV